jgi:hypothetical protein
MVCLTPDASLCQRSIESQIANPEIIGKYHKWRRNHVLVQIPIWTLAQTTLKYFFPQSEEFDGPRPTKHDIFPG